MCLNPPKNSHVRNTIPYPESSDVVVNAKALLKKLRLVRLKQDSCPGSGHFAAGRAAVESLIRLGFSGKLEVIHATDPDSMVNMPLCYDGFAAGYVDKTGPIGNKVRVEYVKLPKIHEMQMMAAMGALKKFFQQRTRLPLGIFGAADGYGNESDGLPFTSPAQDLNTRCSIVLQPFAWNRIRMIEDLDTGFKEQILQGSLSSYIIEVPDWIKRIPPYQWDARRIGLLYKRCVGEYSSRLTSVEVGTVSTTLAKAIRGNCYLMPVYGLHANYPGRNTINTLVRSVHKMQADKVLDKLVVIFNIRGGYDADVESLKMCKHLKANATPTAKVIEQADSGIIVIRSAGLPSALFQQMAAHASLPMLLEGANTANLCLQVGTPYLAFSDNASIPTLNEEGAKGHVILRSIAKFLWGKKRATGKQIFELCSAIYSAVKPGYPLYNYFQRLHKIVRAPGGDQLSFALSRIYEQAQQTGKPIESPPVKDSLKAVPITSTKKASPKQKGASSIYKCPRCKNFAKVGPGTCWRCGVRLLPE